MGDLLFLAGQGPADASGKLVGGSFEQQARQTLQNLESVASAAGASLRQAVRVGVFLNDLGNFAEFNRIYAEYFGEPLPARTTIETNLPGFDLEVDAVVWCGGEA